MGVFAIGRHQARRGWRGISREGGKDLERVRFG